MQERPTFWTRQHKVEEVPITSSKEDQNAQHPRRFRVYPVSQDTNNCVLILGYLTESLYSGWLITDNLTKENMDKEENCQTADSFVKAIRIAVEWSDTKDRKNYERIQSLQKDMSEIEILFNHASEPTFTDPIIWTDK